MWLKTFLRVRRVVTLFALTLMLGEVYGQNTSYTNRFYVVEYDDGNDLTQQSVESQTNDQDLIFAFKTNLLFDALTMINFEVEVPIDNSWSIAGELIFPWWTMDNHRADSKRNRLQLINGNIEGRYWFGDRALQSLLTGWFAGIYTGVGTYDLEYHARGYQGDIFFTVGASGGYSHSINKSDNLRLEYSLGVGYMTTFYHYYEAEFCDNERWHAVEMRCGRYKWVGPTRAKVSLSWLIDYKLKR